MQLAGGGSHSVALLADGSVAAWGNNWNGQCNVSSGISNIVVITAGSAHTLVLQRETPSPAQPASPVWRANDFSTLVLTAPGKRYALEYKNSIADTNWTALPTVFGNGVFEFLLDRNAGSAVPFLPREAMVMAVGAVLERPKRLPSKACRAPSQVGRGAILFTPGAASLARGFLEARNAGWHGSCLASSGSRLGNQMRKREYEKPTG